MHFQENSSASIRNILPENRPLSPCYDVRIDCTSVVLSSFVFTDAYYSGIFLMFQDLSQTFLRRASFTCFSYPTIYFSRDIFLLLPFPIPRQLFSAGYFSLVSLSLPRQTFFPGYFSLVALSYTPPGHRTFLVGRI